MSRVYCGRVGRVFEARPDGQCPECGALDMAHVEVFGDVCGAFASCCAVYASPHGHPCELLAGHAGAGRGACACPDASAACRAAEMAPRLQNQTAVRR